MARGKFNKRGGGPRLDAVNAEEIELRNAQLAEREEQRAARRAESDSEEEGGEEEEEKVKDDKPTGGKPKTGGPQPKGQVTTQADHKRNMAKLAEVRKRREQAEARRKEEQEDQQELEAERKRLAKLAVNEADSDNDDQPKLDKVAIKRMKPAQMKEALKARGLDIQGNAKVLQKRLLDYEASR